LRPSRSTGSYNDAITALRNEAFDMGANYVQIYTMTSPRIWFMCRDNSYRIEGMAFRAPSD
jgi:hypothetical protein